LQVVRGPAAWHSGRWALVRAGDDRVNVIIDYPEMLKALSPVYALKFMVGQVGIAFFALAAVVLAVTGAEAL
jgi:K+ transporter